jgi:hypothetical protein
MSFLSKLSQVFKILQAGRTIRTLFTVLFKLMDGHKEGMPLGGLAADVAAAVASDLNLSARHVTSGKLVRLVKVADWLIAEVYSLFPSRAENIKKLPE